jgi:outer membrane lipoprotein-sorting protein
MQIPRPHRRSILAVLAAGGLALSARAGAPAPGLGREDQALVDRAVSYLDGLTSERGRFVQTDARGEQTTGAFVLQRPGRARFDYDPPSGLVIASNGFKVTVVNRRLRTIESYPLGATPLGLFLARHIRLDRGVRVTQVDRSPGGFSIAARDGGKRNQGSIVLDFTDPPLRLAGWTVINAQGQSVRVRLTDFGPSAPLGHASFELADPARQTLPVPAG